MIGTLTATPVSFEVHTTLVNDHVSADGYDDWRILTFSNPVVPNIIAATGSPGRDDVVEAWHWGHSGNTTVAWQRNFDVGGDRTVNKAGNTAHSIDHRTVDIID